MSGCDVSMSVVSSGGKGKYLDVINIVLVGEAT